MRAGIPVILRGQPITVHQENVNNEVVQLRNMPFALSSITPFIFKIPPGYNFLIDSLTFHGTTSAVWEVRGIEVLVQIGKSDFLTFEQTIEYQLIGPLQRNIQVLVSMSPEMDKSDTFLQLQHTDAPFYSATRHFPRILAPGTVISIAPLTLTANDTYKGNLRYYEVPV
jgi:hypothetical protein